MDLDLTAHFSASLSALGDGLHFAAHSHHLWPDVTRAAHLRYWDDSARLADRKWERIFEDIIPEAQAHIARQLHLPDARSIAFAPNTHELLLRLLSCLPVSPAPKILTTDSEFHSAERQFRRLEEAGLLEVTRIPTLPYESFPQRFQDACRKPGWDMVFFSQVFFNSGYAPNILDNIVTAVTGETMIVIDGYHGFMALPTDLSAIAHRVFYLAGGYKYAMAGEGACFLHVPPGNWRPRNSGWFAAFGALEAAGAETVAYAPGGAGFLGATFDASGLYRFTAVQRWLAAEGVTVAKIHQHVAALQADFIQALPPQLAALPLAVTAPDERGHFLTFITPDAAAWHAAAKTRQILTDYRGDRWRFGFGLYHTPQQLRQLMDHLAPLGL